MKPRQKDLRKFADTLFDAVNGICRLEQEGIKAVATSLAVSLLPDQIRMDWENRTEESREVPCVMDLIEFIRKKSDNPMYKEKPSQHPTEQKRGGRNQHSRQKASVNVSTPQPAKQATHQQPQHAPSAPSPQPSSQPSQQSHHQRKAPAGSQYPPTRYPCKLCSEHHYLYVCSAFEKLTAAQRKEHVISNNSCQNCLKPGHSAAECRSDYRCKYCSGKHHSMIHLEGAGTPGQTPAATVNITSTPSTDQVPKNLLMTCQVLLTGPTGRTLRVRALLDSGATMSLITTKTMNALALKKSPTFVSITGVQNTESGHAHCLTNFILSPPHNPGLSYQVVAAAVPEVTCDLPQGAAHSVKMLPHLQGLPLADPDSMSQARLTLSWVRTSWANLFLAGMTRLDQKALPLLSRQCLVGPSGENTRELNSRQQGKQQSTQWSQPWWMLLQRP